MCKKTGVCANKYCPYGTLTSDSFQGMSSRCKGCKRDKQRERRAKASPKCVCNNCRKTYKLSPEWFATECCSPSCAKTNREQQDYHVSESARQKRASRKAEADTKRAEKKREKLKLEALRKSGYSICRVRGILPIEDFYPYTLGICRKELTHGKKHWVRTNKNTCYLITLSTNHQPVVKTGITQHNPHSRFHKGSFRVIDVIREAFFKTDADARAWEKQLQLETEHMLSSTVEKFKGSGECCDIEHLDALTKAFDSRVISNPPNWFEGWDA